MNEPVNVVAVLQARVSSTRLPGKVLLPLLDKPMLARQIERTLRSKLIDKLIVATSQDAGDDAIADLCATIGVPVFRGSLSNVLDRFYNAVVDLRPKHVVRLTGDCPLADPEVIDGVINHHISGGYDYTSNVVEPTYPDGLDAEILTFQALDKVWHSATDSIDLEHVTHYICKNPKLFRIGSFKSSRNLSHWRWTVDESKDFQLVELVYKALYTNNPEFSMNDVDELLTRNPSMAALNSNIERNAGLNDALEKAKAPAQTKIPLSLELQSRAKKRIPGFNQLLSKRPDQFSYGVWPAYYTKAEGVTVWDLDGNQYIDMSIGGIGANVLGYADPDVNEAVIEAIRSGSSSSLNCPEEVELGDLLCELHPWASKVRYARTGGEAMAVAVRIARAHTGRDKVAFCGYHGWHDWYLAANVGTENALGEHLLQGLNPLGVPKALVGTALPFRYNKIEELKAILSKHGNDLAAIVMEPIRDQAPLPGFLEEVRQLATQHHAVLIVDEISAGFRLNTGGAHLTLGMHPDIAVFSKALGNGFPIAAIVGNRIMEAAQVSFISSTNWSERTGPAAALATIRKFRDKNVSANLVQTGQTVQLGWKRLGEKHGLALSVGGIPPLSHFGFVNEKKFEMKAVFVQEMLKKGFLASTSFYPMYAHREEHTAAYLESADKVFATIAHHLRLGTLHSILEGSPSADGFKRLT